MVALPPMTTIHLVKQNIEETQEKRNRGYIGASGLGHECSRKVWYEYNGAPQSDMGWSVLCAIEDGHATEDVMAERLRAIEGITLLTHDDNKKQFGFDYKGEGWFRGHYDGVIHGIVEAPKTWHIWEHKTKNPKYFNELKKLINIHGEKNALKNGIIYITVKRYCICILPS